MKIDMAIISSVGAIGVVAAGVVWSYATLEADSSHTIGKMAENTADIKANTNNINTLSKSIGEQKIIIKNIDRSLQEEKMRQKERYDRSDEKLNQIIRNLAPKPVQ